MLAQVHFPFFDSRFALEDSDQLQKLAPRWLYADSSPAILSVGLLGAVSKWIPPRPYARCAAADLIGLQVAGATADPPRLSSKSIELIADQHGHARLSVLLEATLSGLPFRLGAVVESLATAELMIQHPARRAVYEMVVNASSALADIYALESAGTAAQPGEYRADLVQYGRPFLILVNDRRENVEVDRTSAQLSTAEAGFQGRIHFFPWQSEDGEFSLPVWYVEAPRGGSAWLGAAEALQDATAHYEELFLCTLLQNRIAQDGAANANILPLLERHHKRLAGTLRRAKRNGVDLLAALRLLSDYDRSELEPRASDVVEKALLNRAQREVASGIALREVAEITTARSIYMTVNNYTGNVINYGIMADNTITITNTLLADSPAPSELKTKLEELRAPLLDAAKGLPEADAKALLKDYENFTEAALREKPPTEMVKAQGNQLITAVKNIAAFATPVAVIVGAILKIVAG
jgi:hypothetical protein